MRTCVWTILAAVAMAATVAAETRIADSGDFTIGGQRFFVLHRDGGWRSKPQDRNSVVPDQGFPQRQDGRFRLAGSYLPCSGERFRFEEAMEPQKDGSWNCRIEMNSAKGTQTRLLALATHLQLNEFAGKKIRLNGEKLGFGTVLDPADWGIARDVRDAVLEIPLADGMLTVRGRFALKLQDERKFNLGHWALWLFWEPHAGLIQQSRIALNFKFQPWQSSPVAFGGAANMGFADKVADDGKGGWTDQGPGNDLACFKPGEKRFGGLRFDIPDPARNHGRSCILLGGKYRPKFPLAADIPVPGVEARTLYLLHAAAWEQPKGTPLGKVVVTFDDGRIETLPLVSGIDINNFWNPIPCANAAPVWNDANQSAGVGLYLTRLPLGKPGRVRSLRLESAGNAVWLVVGATLSIDDVPLPSRCPVIMAPDRDWMAVNQPGKVKAGSALDLAGLLDAPAGKYGFVRFDGEHFSFEQKSDPIRFWGANICQEAQFMDNAALARLADDYARYGYNFARFHQFDHRVHKVEGKSSTALDSAKMDRLDRLAWELKRRGVYWTIDLYTRRVLAAGELPEFPDQRLTMEEFKALVYVSESAMRNWEQAAANLLNHVNPYTGLAWKADPALISISLINEDTLFAVWNKNPKVAAIYEKKFAAYCQARQLAVTPANHLNLMRRFLIDIHAQGYGRMKTFLRSLGVRAALNSQNYWIQAALTLSRNVYDVVDNHFYWGHPEFLGKNWSLPAVVASDCAVRRFGGSLAAVAPTRIFGKPFTITEWDFVNPGAFAAEGAFLIGAYASLQDWDGLCRFTYTHDPQRIAADESPMFLFDIVNDPIRSLSERAGALFFLRRDVQASRVAYPVTVAGDCLEKDAPEFFADDANRASLLGKAGSLAEGAPLPAGSRPVPDLSQQRRFVSDTGELTLDAGTGVFQAVTPRSEGFVLPEEAVANGKFAVAKGVKSWGCVLVAALDGAPLESSKRLLLLHLTEAKNSGMRFADQSMTLIEDWGKAPQLMRRGVVDLTLNRAFGADATLYMLGMDGTRLAPVPMAVSGGKSLIRLDNNRNGRAVAAYELIVK